MAAEHHLLNITIAPGKEIRKRAHPEDIGTLITIQAHDPILIGVAIQEVVKVHLDILRLQEIRLTIVEVILADPEVAPQEVQELPVQEEEIINSSIRHKT